MGRLASPDGSRRVRKLCPLPPCGSSKYSAKPQRNLLLIEEKLISRKVCRYAKNFCTMAVTSEVGMESGTNIIGSWLMGKDLSCDIVISHPTVSSQHCRLTQYERQFTLEDMGSTNGTFVDGIRLTPRLPVIVNRQQEITLGKQV